MLTFIAKKLFFLLRNRLVQNECGKLLMGDAWWNETFGYFCAFAPSMSIENKACQLQQNILAEHLDESYRGTGHAQV